MSPLKLRFFHFSYKKILKPILFKMDPEKVHDAFLKIGGILGKFSLTRAITRWCFLKPNKLKQEIHGIKFPNPVGLSAGFDKNADTINIMPEVGFGFMQIGTVTNQAYQGNPKPRLYRLPKSKALVVYYGLKNIGVDKILPKIASSKKKLPISISIGATNDKSTAKLEDAIEDYYQGYKKSVQSGLADFLTINISCPNTFGGEPFTTPHRLDLLLKRLKEVKNEKPIFLKMPIDLNWDKFKKLLEVAEEYKIDGIIIGNLAKDHQSDLIVEKIPKNVKGGISGKPAQNLADYLISKTYQEYGKKFVIVGVGGIFSAQDAYKKIKAGASLVQLIAGMIFEGPQLITQINLGIEELLKKDEFKNIQEAIGADHKK